ncbi:hypothetical protein R1sor_005828 [Riccia sorocarpa]|uniref:Uncharacterized protein n=1 Tax=Riccia sorocarpa TaxID=122646 RepID=A0ABD3HKX7_9MARC
MKPWDGGDGVPSEAWEPRVDDQLQLVGSMEEDLWARNFREGLSNMIANSPCPPRAVYIREATSKGRRGLQEMYPPTCNQAVISPTVSDFPEIPSEDEIEDQFLDVWVEAKLAVEALSQYLVGNRHNIFDKSAFVNRVRPDTFFFKPNHKDYVIIAGLYQVFLKDFESESFGSSSEPPTAVLPGQCFEVRISPDVRAVRSYLYYKSGRSSTDVDYMDWFRARVMEFCEVLDISLAPVASFATHADGPTILNALGGPYLVSYFTDVALACWKLQTLAFAFKEPVVRLNVGDDDAFDETLMVPVVDEEEEESEVEALEDMDGELAVSFKVCPGFRFPGTGNVIRAEIYPILLASDPSF